MPNLNFAELILMAASTRYLGKTTQMLHPACKFSVLKMQLRE